MSRFSALNRRWAVAIAICLTLLASAAVAQPPGMKSPEHDLLKKDVGTWDAKMKIYPTPNAEPIESEAVETCQLFGNGLWLLSEFEGKIGDMPFAGKSAMGFDPVEKKYVGNWIDNMSPWFTSLKGEYDADTKTMTMTAESRDMATGKMQTTKHVANYIDDDTRTFAIYMPGEDGGEDWKMLEVEYKRRK